MKIEFSLDGETVECPQDITVAGALYLLARRQFRITPRQSAPRSFFCGMGVCFDCLVEVDGRSNVRACQTRVEPGMKVVTQYGEADLGGVG